MTHYLDQAGFENTELPSQAGSIAVSFHSHQNPVPDQSDARLPPYIKYLGQCRLLICKAHGICLTRNNLSEHLKQDHGMSYEKSGLAFEAAWEFDVAPTRSGIILPPADAPPIPRLQVQLGFKCTVEECCPFLSPNKESLDNHFAKHGGRHKHSSDYRKVAMQNLFPGRRPLYFVVNTSATPGESSTAWAAAEVGNREDGLIQDDSDTSSAQEYSSMTSKSKNREDGLIQEDIRASLSQEYADGQNSSSARPGRGLRPSLEPGPSTSPSLSSALSLPLAAVNSQSTSQLALSSKPTLLVPKNTIFLSKRQDTGKFHICLASDITSPDSQAAVLDPSCVHFESYCELLTSEKIIDQEKGIDLGFQPIGGERIPISNQMMFRAAVTYQLDRKLDMVTFSAAVAVPT